MTNASSGDLRRPISRVPARDLAITAEVRAELARQNKRGRTQAEIAFELFGERQSWLNRRLNGLVAFTPAELLTLADWLEVDIVDWLSKAKRAPTPSAAGGRPVEVGALTEKKIAPQLRSIRGDRGRSKPPRGARLRLLTAV